jgi:hypothetical protein
MIGRRKQQPTPEQIAAHYAEQAVVAAAVRYVEEPTAEHYIAVERSVHALNAAWADVIPI